MKKIVFTLFTAVFCSLALQAQVEERFRKGGETNPNSSAQKKQNSSPSTAPQPAEKSYWDWDNVLIGGNVSLSFGSNSSFIYVAPSVGYRFHEKLMAGVGFIYQYSNYNATQGINVPITEETSIYGPKLFAYYFPFNFIYGGFQFEYLNHDFYSVNAVTGELMTEKLWTPVLFIEAGISQPVGAKGSVQIGVRYNLLDSYDSPYSSGLYPVIGIMF